MEHEVKRYRQPTRVFHWVHTAAFLVLFLTGLVLFVPPIAILAQDSWTRVIYRVAALVFVIAPLIYVPMNWKATLKGVKEAFTWGVDDLGWLQAAPRYYFLADERAMPPQPHMNSGQKLWWFMVLVFSCVFIATGFVMWGLKTTAPHVLLQWMVFIHDVAFITTGAMLFVHIYLSVMHPLMGPASEGAWSSMARGKVSAEYARSHHRKWYDEIAAGEKTVGK